MILNGPAILAKAEVSVAQVAQRRSLAQAVADLAGNRQMLFKVFDGPAILAKVEVGNA